MPAQYPGHNKTPLTVTVTRGLLSNEKYANIFYALVAGQAALSAPDDSLSAIAMDKCVLLVVAQIPTGMRCHATTIRVFVMDGTNAYLETIGAMARVRSAVLEKNRDGHITMHVKFRKFSLSDMM